MMPDPSIGPGNRNNGTGSKRSRRVATSALTGSTAAPQAPSTEHSLRTQPTKFSKAVGSTPVTRDPKPTSSSRSSGSFSAASSPVTRDPKPSTSSLNVRPPSELSRIVAEPSTSNKIENNRTRSEIALGQPTVNSSGRFHNSVEAQRVDRIQSAANISVANINDPEGFIGATTPTKPSFSGDSSPLPGSPEKRTANIESAASAPIKVAAAAQVKSDSAQGFADWAVADAASLGINASTIQTIGEEANSVRQEKLPSLIKDTQNKTADANRVIAKETYKELGVEPTEENIQRFADVLREAKSDDERRQIIAQTIDGYDKQQTYDEVRPQIDNWVTDTLGAQSALVDREDLLVDVESMVVNGLSPAEIKVAIQDRLENIRTRGLDSISSGTVVDVYDEAHVVNTGLKIDQRQRERTQRQVLDTMQITLGVSSDDALAERLGVPVDQLGNTLLVRNAQNANDPEDAIVQLQTNPQYQANAERRRLANIASSAIADGGGYGVTMQDIGLEGITDLAVQGDIIENSGAVDAALAELSQSLGPNGEAVPINLTQAQRNELALERGFLNRNLDSLNYTSDDVDAHVAMRANTLHWQNQSKADIAEWQAQGIIPEFGYNSVQSGQQLDFENNAARTAWAVDVANRTSEDINAWQAERIGVTQGVADATERLFKHWERYDQETLSFRDQEVLALDNAFDGGYRNALNRLQENPSVDQIQGSFTSRV